MASVALGLRPLTPKGFGYGSFCKGFSGYVWDGGVATKAVVIMVVTIVNVTLGVVAVRPVAIALWWQWCMAVVPISLGCGYGYCGQWGYERCG
jgi:hypothetical protein